MRSSLSRRALRATTAIATATPTAAAAARGPPLARQNWLLAAARPAAAPLARPRGAAGFAPARLLASSGGAALEPFEAQPANKAATMRQRQADTADGATGMKRAVLWAAGYYSEASVQMRASKMVYESCAERAESPAMLQACDLPDNFDSRFNLLVLHMWMFLVRMRSVPAGGQKMSQIVYDMWLEDMEDKLGEQDFNFLDVSKFSKEFQRTFYGSGFAYDQSLKGSDAVLAGALCRNVFNIEGSEPDAVTVARTAGYVRQQLHLLESLTDDEITKEGKLPWV